ncbi:long-chain fatty acid transporter [Legionella impletisoli]|uniref:Long-chain fatty acid transporter n=2 Tax=Legionella impletisoli TaxID=343510 RepID=A0A917N9Y8_9GAMM|nr:outer membrane protein transport protein [Legionella impletisoli]GGI80268.1 long-chain fatty acid transporter [Legionella impletisoli]
MQTPRRTYLSTAILAALASSAVHAGGFSLYTEGSGAAIGNYAAGIAAEVADASIGWYNPAGLVFLDKEQVVLSGVGVFPSTKLSGTSTFSTLGLPPYVQTFSGLEASVDALVPAFHYALPLSDRAAFGLSVVSPFGLSTEYSTTSPVRYAATFTELLTANLSPEFGYKLTDNFSVGAGLDWQWSQVKFNRMLGTPTALQAQLLPPTLLDSLSYNKGHSTGVGFHAGALAMFNDQHTRVGLNYQSKMHHVFHGFSELRGPLADAALTDAQAVLRSDGLFSNEIHFPEVITLSGYHDVTDKLALLGSVVFTGWNVFQETQLNNVAAFSPLVGQIVTNSTTEQNYRDAWRFALGANYQVNDQWMMRVGGGYDQTPTVDVERDVRLPDANRWALSIGSHYQYNPALGFDIGYTYLFAGSETTVNKTDLLGTTSSYNVNARAKPHANLVGLQAVWTIDKEVVKTK